MINTCTSDFETRLLPQALAIARIAGGGEARLLVPEGMDKSVVQRTIQSLWGDTACSRDVKIICLSQCERLTRLVDHSMTYLVEFTGAVPAGQTGHFLISSDFGLDDLQLQIRRHLRNRRLKGDFKVYDLMSAYRMRERSA